MSRMYIFALKIGLIITFCSYVIYSIVKGDNRFLEMTFNGRVQSIVITEKNTPQIVVGNKSYLLRTTKDFMKKVKIGDSVIKKNGERNVTAFSRNTKKKLIITF